MESRSWIIETRGGCESHGHAVKRHILTARSQFQEIQLVESERYGLVLVLDGVTQSSELDEFIYHEALIHPAMCAHPAPRDVLIVGGAEGADLREVFKHPTVEHATMVDIDGDLVEICREHLGPWHRGAFDDPRTELIIGDGRAFLESHPRSYDCIVLDLSDPCEGSPARMLFTAEFYALAREALRDDQGVLALQATGAALGSSDAHFRIVRTLGEVFPTVLPYHAHIPLYATLYGFALCGGPDLTITTVTGDTIDQVVQARGITDLRFYDGPSAHGMFGTPRYLRDALASDAVALIRDEDPLAVWHPA